MCVCVYRCVCAISTKNLYTQNWMNVKLYSILFDFFSSNCSRVEIKTLNVCSGSYRHRVQCWQWNSVFILCSKCHKTVYALCARENETGRTEERVRRTHILKTQHNRITIGIKLSSCGRCTPTFMCYFTNCTRIPHMERERERVF